MNRAGIGSLMGESGRTMSDMDRRIADLGASQGMAPATQRMMLIKKTAADMGKIISEEDAINQAVRITKNGFKNSDGCNEEKPNEYHRIDPLPKSVPKIGKSANAMKANKKPITPRRRIDCGDSIEKNTMTNIDKPPKHNCRFT